MLRLLILSLVGLVLVFSQSSPGPHAGGHHFQMPQNLTACVAMLNQTHVHKVRNTTQWQAAKTCAQACLSAAGIVPPAYAAGVKSCFQNASAAAKAEFQSLQSSSQSSASARSNFLGCVSTSCNQAPFPRPTGPPPTHASRAPHQQGSGAYNASNPRDQRRCSIGLLMQAAHPATQTSHAKLTTAAAATLKTCLATCHPEGGMHHPEQTSGQSSGQHSSFHPRAMSSQSSGGHPMGGHGGKGGHGRMGHKGKKHQSSCLKAFCTKADFEKCRPQPSAAEQADLATFQTWEAQEFTTTCNCLKGQTGNTDASCDNSATGCTTFFQAEEQKRAAMEAKFASWKAAHPTSPATP